MYFRFRFSRDDLSAFDRLSTMSSIHSPAFIERPQRYNSDLHSDSTASDIIVLKGGYTTSDLFTTAQSLNRGQ